MLDHIEHTLPSSGYFDPDIYQLELEKIWWREWLCVARADQWSSPGDYRVFTIGDQQVLVTLNQNRQLNAFHNTCRHRGSLLCEQNTGIFSGHRIVCPYHSWTYSLDGELTHTPRRFPTADFDTAQHGLYPVRLEIWRGFVFICLDVRQSKSVAQTLGDGAGLLANWPLEKLVVAGEETYTLACNWKIFWENYCECYHCPGAHPDLCRIVPVYRHAVVDPADLQGKGFDSENGIEGGNTAGGTPRLTPGAVTWSHDGQTQIPWFDTLSPEEHQAGMTFCDSLPSMFIIAHVDYVRSVHVMPTGPESTVLTVRWMLAPDTLSTGRVDIERLMAFGRQVVTEDARVCELNQKGLRSRAHQRGTLVPQEYDVLEFDRWVLRRLARE